jgi:hypothetical protein
MEKIYHLNKKGPKVPCFVMIEKKSWAGWGRMEEEFRGPLLKGVKNPERFSPINPSG